MYRALAGENPKEVIYITLQEVFWIVSIGWILIQVLDKFRDKKEVSRLPQTDGSPIV